MKKYLIFANTGGEMESPECSYSHYYICNGDTIEEAIKNWDSKVDEYMSITYSNWKEDKLKHENYMQSIIPNYQKYKECDGIWYSDGRKLQIVELKEYEENSIWKELIWQ